jgi:ribose transport system substrate-binding protein
VAGKQIPPFIKNDDAFFDATNAKKDFALAF